MDVIVLDQILSLDTAPVHVAPGGSILCTVSGKSVDVSGLLRNLREEVAFGMVSFKTISKSDKVVEAVVYLGAADADDFKRVADDHANCIVSTKDIAEGTELTGLSMRARNQIINALD